MMIFQDRLKITREKKGLSQSELAKISGLHPSTISHFESGQREPCIRNVKKLCSALLCSSDYLLGITEDIVEMELSDLKHRIRLVREILK